MMKCIIVDDEPLAREGMRMNIGELSNLTLVGEFENAAAANEFLEKNQVDIMFLDIEMPGLSGLEFLRSLSNAPMVILTTAYPQYAVEAYELDVVDYLVKPIKLERFIKAVAKAEEFLSLAENTAVFEAIEDEFIFIKSERKYVKIRFDELLFVEGLKDYVIVHATHGKYMTAMNVKTIHNKLPEDIFFRVSKSFVINVNHIDDIDGNYVNIREYKIPIGRSYRDVFLDFVNKRLLRR
ncbi:MAG: LytTR family DNA-binding domain-containing protein [Bacteroidales bacterium]|nr:LytTR family DNA-binding domain-containing protein [Bacteroidales bacterium]MCK9499388.1 LytTR family DNA-binding domain-containing protein [Bacteroidales bacterium]MDY0315133.1 LytTR family DNA-binding domain-containing protein [Bacteroidales bacterium]